MTKREYFATIMNLVADNEELKAMTEHEIELLDKRNAYKSSKPSAKQIANEKVKEEILMILASASEPMSTKAIRGMVKGSPQYITSLMTQLVKAEKVHKDYVKKEAVYSIA